MITNAILDFFALIFNNTFGALPSSPTLPLNSQATNVVAGGLFAHLGWANAYFPLDQVVLGVTVLVSLLGIMFLVRIGLWLATKLHLLGGAGD